MPRAIVTLLAGALMGCTADDAQSVADAACGSTAYTGVDPVSLAMDAAALAACFWSPQEPAPRSTLEPLTPRPGYTGKSNRTPVYTAPLPSP